MQNGGKKSPQREMKMLNAQQLAEIVVGNDRAQERMEDEVQAW